MRYWVTMMVIGCVVLPLVSGAMKKFLGFELGIVSYVGFTLSILGIIMDRQDRIMDRLKEIGEWQLTT